MPRKKASVKASSSVVSRIRENSRLMQTHESMVDYLSGRSSMSSLMDVFVPNFLGLNFLKPLEDDLIYSDDDDYYDDDDNEYDDGFPCGAANKPLAPHPQIKQLTDEEADKLAKEEERRKDKTEKNKLKKKRKKERKRLEKKNAVKNNLPEEEQAKSASLENHQDSAIIESYPKVNKPSQDDESQNPIEAAGGEKNQSNAEKSKELKMKKEKDLDLQNSKASTAKSVPAETYNQKPSGEQKKEKNASLTDQQPKGIKPAAEKPAVQKKKGEKHEISKEKTVDSTDALTKRSREFANMGNRLAASGQYEMAVSYFTDAIKCNPKEFKLFGNRSLCYERIQQYENALQDADVALSMEPNWIKGLFRKGKALCGLKRYFEASLTYLEVLKLESTSVEATQELKRAQTLHLMELGFSWAQSTEALKAHSTLNEAVEALFMANRHAATQAVGAASALTEVVDDNGEWTVLQASRSRTQQIRESGEARSKSHSPTPHSRNLGKPELYPVWVGTLGPAMTYVRLHELFSRTGTVYSIKMLLEQQCAFVNYTKQEDCDRAIKCLHGMLVDGAPLTVRYPFKGHSELGASKSGSTDPFTRGGTYKKECFFWRTSGCTRQDCTFRHIPENKNIDREKFTSGLGWNQK